MFFIRKEGDLITIEKAVHNDQSGLLVETIPDLGDVLWDYGFTEKQIEHIMNAFDDGVSIINLEYYNTN